MGNKAVEKTCNINNVFHPGTADEPGSALVLREALQEESLEDKEHIGWPSEVDNNQLRGSIEADPLTRT